MLSAVDSSIDNNYVTNKLSRSVILANAIAILCAILLLKISDEIRSAKTKFYNNKKFSVIQNRPEFLNSGTNHTDVLIENLFPIESTADVEHVPVLKINYKFNTLYHKVRLMLKD